MNPFFRKLLALAEATPRAEPSLPSVEVVEVKGVPMSSRIYVASSWRNPHQPSVVEALRGASHQVYDFRHPLDDKPGFSWGDIAARWKQWSPDEYVTALASQEAQEGFVCDWNAMVWADTCVLVLPCGRSAHLEAGYFRGAGKKLHILLHPDGFEAELMYRMADGVHTSLDTLLIALAGDFAVDRHWAND